MTDMSDTFKQETVQSESNMIKDSSSIKEKFSVSVPRPMSVEADDDVKKENNNDLIETDDELLEVGSNEGPDESEDDDEEFNEDNSNFSTPLDFTTGRKLSDSGEWEAKQNYFRPWLQENILL